jgi:predicted nucleic-acid-binding protein
LLAIDTNVVVRLLTGDTPAQMARAKALIESQDVFVASTVLLETDWVLRSVYGFEQKRIIDALTAFIGLPHVRLQERDRVVAALAWTAGGLEFADALHLAAAGGSEAFVSFDKHLKKAAQRLADIPIREP